jgi:hypothetical protein
MKIEENTNGYRIEQVQYLKRVFFCIKSSWFFVLLFILLAVFLNDGPQIMILSPILVFYLVHILIRNRHHLKSVRFGENEITLEYYRFNSLKSETYSYQNLRISRELLGYRITPVYYLSFKNLGKSICKQFAYGGLTKTLLDKIEHKYHSMKFANQLHNVRN